MDHLRKFVRLPASERLLLVRAVILVGAVRVALWLLPFKVLQQISAKPVQTCAASRKESRLATERGIWAVHVASLYVPHATCLTQALAAHVLLAFDGIPASVRIGVAKEKGGNFEAHAWLESDGKILMGGEDADQRYTRLLALRPWAK